MKEKLRVFIVKIGILSLMMAMMLLPTMGAQAASAKSKAMKAYKKMLSQQTIDWSGDGSYMPSLNNSKFGLAYINNDGIPELVVENPNTNSASGFGRLYTWKNGKVVEIARFRNMEHVDELTDTYPFAYYKKTGIFKYCNINFGNAYETFLKLTGTKTKNVNLYHFALASELWKIEHYSIDKSTGTQVITRAQFNKKLKKLVGSQKATPLKFHKNTKKNRSKCLK